MEQLFSSNSEIRRQLLQPRPDTRDHTRWWWFGCAVEHGEICRELDCMAAAGIGGVELQILYPLRADDPEKGIQNRFYLSPGYFEAIKFACDEAHRRGLQFDLTLGSSWPYGGPFVSEEMSAADVIPYTIDVQGPRLFSYDFTTRIYGECVGCVMGKMEKGEMLPETVRDITDQVQIKYLFGWEWGKELRGVEIPKGTYKIVIFVISDKKQMVLKPLPGGDGMIIDHNRREALREFLKYGGDPIVEHLDGSHIDNFFCDSIEVFGQNWTKILYDEFRRRRGYELRPWLYALWGEVRGMTEQIRYDCQKTLAELTVENFFSAYTQWAHEKGSLSRIQAHGTWGDILRAYGAADIPEGETFSAFDKYEVNTIHRRLASSAGHIYGKPLISNESFTWLRFPRFIVTLENLKAASDAIFLDGMNQIVNHGYAYSAPENGKPGWAFYASSQINHANTWWQDFPELSRYMNRVCDFLRRGKTKVKLAIYLPQHDIWAENPLSDLHMCMKLEERMTTAVVDAIQKAGFWFDYINDDAAERLDELGYEAVLFLECDRMPVQTARAFQRYAQTGHSLICRGRLPSLGCGWMNYAEKTAEVSGIFQELASQGRCVVTADENAAMLEALRAVMTPDVEMTCRPDAIGYVHQIMPGQDIYFLANITPDACQESVLFHGQNKPFSVFDPMTAREKPVENARLSDDDTEVTLEMEPFQSLIFIFGAGMEAQARPAPARREILTLADGWKLSVPERQYTAPADLKTGWEQLSPLRYYSGDGYYCTQFTLTKEQLSQLSREPALCFEHLGESGAVRLNGREAGKLIKRPWMLPVGGFLREGSNTLEVRVTNLLINQEIDPAYKDPHYDEDVIPNWPYSTGKLNRGLAERASNWRERSMIHDPLPSGLWGRVWLTAE